MAATNSGNYMKQIIKSLLPHGFVSSIQRRNREFLRGKWNELDSQRVADQLLVSYSYEKSIEFLCSRGTPEDQVRQGSMPEASLRLVANIITSELQGTERVTGIHIGNFLGVSLAYLVHAARAINPKSLLIGIDPNIPHRGVASPQHEVMALLDHFALTSNALCVAAYSLEKSISNDGKDYSGDYNPDTEFSREHSCEHGLQQLGRFLNGSIDFILLDGNHDGQYLQRELDHCTALLRPGGILILDDVSQAWMGIVEQFDQLGHHFEKLTADGRIGVAKRIPFK
jgi:hypothetical protein